MIILTKLIIFKQSPGYIKHFFLHDYGLQALKQGLHKANFIPFHSIRLYLTSHDPDINVKTNLLGNIAGFIPLGILLPLLFKRLDGFIKTTATVFFISLSFETFQLLSDLGYFDVDDLLLNTIGGMLGYLIFMCTRKWKFVP